MSAIRVGDIAAAPGEKKHGTITIPGNHDPEYNSKIIIVNGVKTGKTLVVTGGIHGTEFASIEAVTRFANMLDPSNMRGSVIAIPVANVPQFRERTQFVCPVDGLNLNDSFPGKKDGSFTESLAYALFDVIRLGDVYVDCHGGDINEDILGFVVAAEGTDPALNQASLELAQCYNTGFIHRFTAEPGLSISAQELLRIPSIMPEAGTPFPVREESVLFHIEGLMNILRYLEILEGEVIRYQSFVSPERIKLYSSHDGVWESYVELNQRVEKDEPIGAVKNPYGDTLEVVKAPERGIIAMKRCYYSVKNGEMLVVLSTI